MKLHGLRQIAPYSNNSLAQSPSKLIRSHAGDWTGGRHLSYSRIRLPKGSSIIQFAPMYGPAVRCKRKREAGAYGLAPMYQAHGNPRASTMISTLPPPTRAKF